MMNQFPISTIGPLDTAEIKPAYFPFSKEVASTTTLISATVEVELISGADPDPQGMVVGAAVIDNTQKLIMQRLTGAGRHGNTYNIRCIATDNLGNISVVAAILPVVFLVTGEPTP